MRCRVGRDAAGLSLWAAEAGACTGVVGYVGFVSATGTASFSSVKSDGSEPESPVGWTAALISSECGGLVFMLVMVTSYS